MRIKVKSLEQIKEDMSHANIGDMLVYDCGLPERILTTICGQWFNVIERRHSRRWPPHQGSIIDSPDGYCWFVIDYLVEDIIED